MKKILFFVVLALIASVNVNAQSSKNESKVQHITYKDFTQKIWDFEKSPNEFVYKGNTLAVVDFYADWCGPCRRVGPIMEKLAETFKDRVTIYKVNVDQEKALASVFQVTSIPMVLFIPVKGQPSKQVGALPEAEYVRIIQSFLDKE